MIPFRAFVLAFKYSPGAALAALWAAVRGLRVRSRNLLYAAAHRQPGYYAAWTSIIEPQKIQAYCQAGPSLEAMPPVIGLIFADANVSAKARDRTLARLDCEFRESLIVITGQRHEDDNPAPTQLRRGNPTETLQSIYRRYPDAWLFPTNAGDELGKGTGDALRRALAASPDSKVIYWDEDRLVGRTRSDPWLKPDWDELLFLATDFLGGTALFKLSELVTDESKGAVPLTKRGVLDAVVSLVNKTNELPAVLHVPLILSHRKSDSAFWTTSDRKNSIEANWADKVELLEISDVPGVWRPRFSPDRILPKVSILIPTRNGHDLLRMCIFGISRLRYSGGVEVIVIDNDSDEERTLEYLNRLKGEGVTVLRHSGPFNFSSMNNRAAEVATGELLCLLNNDIEMHDATWLESMAIYAVRPNVGAVGALLQYPDGTVQHAGVTVGTGEAAGHVYRGIPIEQAGHRNMHRLTRRVSAVTAACLVLRKELYFEVDGLDEKFLQVAFNDVDLCMKLSQLGYRNLFVAEAHLTHHESKSRGSDFTPENRARYLKELAHLQQKWGTKTFVDPYGHPLVMRSSEDFVLGP